MINGASGGLGTFAVQIAKSFGAEVTGVCSTRNLEMVRSIGADHLFDYTQEDVTQNGQRYDLIIDNVGNPVVYKRFHKHSLTANGICVIVAGTFFLRFVLGPWLSITGGNKIGTFMAATTEEDLSLVKELVETGKVSPVIYRRFPLCQVPEAMRYLEQGHARGKVVITVE